MVVFELGKTLLLVPGGTICSLIQMTPRLKGPDRIGFRPLRSMPSRVSEKRSATSWHLCSILSPVDSDGLHGSTRVFLLDSPSVDYYSERPARAHLHLLPRLLPQLFLCLAAGQQDSGLFLRHTDFHAVWQLAALHPISCFLPIHQTWCFIRPMRLFR